MSWLYRVLAVSALIGLLLLGYRNWVTHQQGIGEALATARYNDAIDKQKLEASAVLARETGKTRQAEQALQDFKNEQEIRDEKNKRVVGALADQLRAAAGPAARLRDPNAAAGCGGGGGGASGADPARAGGGAADGAEAGGLLSKQLTEFLLSQAADADQVNLAYISCRADSLSLREVLTPD